MKLVFAWLCVANLVAFVLFGYDKWCAGRPGRARIRELHLLAVGACGGWPGGLLGMLLFRHKTSKLSFQLKYALCLFLWLVLVWAGVAAVNHPASERPLRFPRQGQTQRLARP